MPISSILTCTVRKGRIVYDPMKLLTFDSPLQVTMEDHEV